MLWTACEGRRKAAFTEVLVRFRVREVADIHVFSTSSAHLLTKQKHTKLSKHSSLGAVSEVSKGTVDAPRSLNPQKTQVLVAPWKLSKAQRLTPSMSTNIWVVGTCDISSRAFIRCVGSVTQGFRANDHIIFKHLYFEKFRKKSNNKKLDFFSEPAKPARKISDPLISLFWKKASRNWSGNFQDSL